MKPIEYTNVLSVRDYEKLRKAVGFKVLSLRQMERALKNQAYLVVAKIDDETVGMVRLIFDGSYIAVLVDVIVLPQYQRQGIGRELMGKVLSYLKNSLVEGEQILVLLMAAKDKEGFYEKFGFIKRPDETYGAGMSQWLVK
ncbi:MAG: GNAT family N-acetyltransferase [Nitrososphaerota archaeon]|nr:GNAT family N-acetyltransferase [Nitrososphaerota archaeon]